MLPDALTLIYEGAKLVKIFEFPKCILKKSLQRYEFSIISVFVTSIFKFVIVPKTPLSYKS